MNTIYRGKLWARASEKEKKSESSGKSRIRLNPRVRDNIILACMWLILAGLTAISIHACAKPGGALDHALGIEVEK